MTSRRMLFTVMLAAALPSLAAAGTLRAGAAASNVTPPLGLPLVGGWSPTPSVYVHDELHARALVLDDGRTRLAIAVTDNLGIPRAVFDETRRMLQDKTGLAPENMLFSSTHTHSAASARGKGSFASGESLDEYQRFVARRIAEAVLCAIHNLEPARVGFGSAREASPLFNRRWKMKPGTPLLNPFGETDQVMMNPRPGDPNLLEPAGPVDPEIAFLSVVSASGRPIALLANYSLHYVGGVPAGHVSADYFGIFAERIAELLGTRGQDPPFVGILSNGTSGDVNNIDFTGRSSRPKAPYEQMRRVADLVAGAVHQAWKSVEHRAEVTLAAAARDLPLAVRLPDAKRIAWAENVLKNPPKLHRHEETYARRVLNMKNHPARVAVPLQALRVGEVGIAAIPMETFAETGLEIKRRSPLPHTFTLSLANGSYGYLPTPAQHKLGGYETWLGTSNLEVEAASKIVETILQLLEEVRK